LKEWGLLPPQKAASFHFPLNSQESILGACVGTQGQGQWAGQATIQVMPVWLLLHPHLSLRILGLLLSLLVS
jgi:hypothetical protein